MKLGSVQRNTASHVQELMSKEGTTNSGKASLMSATELEGVYISHQFLADTHVIIVLHGNGCGRGKVTSFCENQHVPAARTLGLKQSICFAVAACKPPKIARCSNSDRSGEPEDPRYQKASN
jgi:hypothetical protein